MARRERPRNRCARKSLGTALRSIRLFETLEPRLLLSGAPWKAGEVSADWFASLQTIDGPIAPGSSNYQQAAQVEHSWVLQLSDAALAQLDSVSQLPAIFESAQLPVRPVRGLGLAGQVVVEGFVDATATEAALRASTLIAHVSPNGVIQGQRTPPNDPKFIDQTALDQLSDLDIDAPEAWDLSKGSRQVVVAVIDSGIDYVHPDLKNNIWVNPGNLRSPDGQALTVGRHGFDFANGDTDPIDDNGHGTNVAGIIGAEGNNKIGIAGVNWATSMVALKFLDENNVGNRDHAVAAINYATLLRKSGVNLRVINASWGDYGDFYQPLFDAIKSAGDAGILFVAASGNGNSLGRGIDLDRERAAFYPASYDLDNIISVGALGKDGQIASFSNFGAQSVDLLAPGEGILTTDRSNTYVPRNGTSFAAPFVSGTATLIAAAKPGAPLSEIRDALLTGVVESVKFDSIVATQGVLNAHKALTSRTFAPRAQAAAITGRTTPGDVTIKVTFTNDVALSPASIGNSEILISPVGFRGKARVAQMDLNSKAIVNDRTITAVYRTTIANSRDNGLYEVILRSNRVRNINGLSAAESVLATFRVDIPDPNLIVVNSTKDIPLASLTGNQMTLRAAIQRANATAGKQVILLKDGEYQLSRLGLGEDTSLRGDLDVTSGVIEIVGSGNEFNSINGLRSDRVFDVMAGGQLVLTGVTVKRGSQAVGGGIRNAGTVVLKQSTVNSSIASGFGGGIANLFGSVLELDQSTIDGNSTTDRTSPFGGAGIYNNGRLTVRRSTLSNNIAAAGFTANGGGGGLYNGEGGTLHVQSATFSGNASPQGRGGGIYNAGTASLNRATVANNKAAEAGGFFNEPGASASLLGCVVAMSGGTLVDIDGVFASRGYNFIGLPSAGTSGFSLTTNDMLGPGAFGAPLDPGLGALADNGSSTKSHLPTQSSPLEDALKVANAGTDQAGVGAVGPADIGAVERFRSLISGRVFNDANGDGQFGVGEVGIAGITVFSDSPFADGSRASEPDEGEPMAVTMADDPSTPSVNEAGTYRFIVGPHTALRLTLVSQAGLLPTTSQRLPNSSPIKFTKLADSSVGISGKLFAEPMNVSVDNNGTVAFAANAASGQLTYYIGKDNAFVTLPIAGINSADNSQLENGELVFISPGTFQYLGSSYSRGVYVRKTDGSLQKIADGNTTIPNTSTKFGSLSFVEPRVSNGVLLFHTENPSAPASLGAVYGSEGGRLFRVDNLSGTVDRGDRFYDADINGNDFAFVTPKGIWARRSSFNTNNIVPQGSGSTAFDFNQPTALALSNGYLSFVAQGSSGQQGVYRYSFEKGTFEAGTIEHLASLDASIPGGTGKFTGFGTELSSEGGNTVFLGHGEGGFQGVYLSIGNQGRQLSGLFPIRSSLQKIIDTNSEIQGSKIVSLSIGSDAIGGNHIAFTASLADGRRVVMLASLPIISQRPATVNQVANDLVDQDFGLRSSPGSIQGNVFNDLDVDTIPDGTDLPLQNWTVFLDQNNDKQRDPNERVVQTNALGDYLFDNLPASQTYHVRLQVQANYNRIFPTNAEDGKWTVALSPGEARRGLDFATVKNDGSSGVGTASKLQGRIYEDFNKNNRFDTGIDAARVGWTVFVDLNSNGILDAREPRVLTQAGGVYQLGNLGRGTYSVRVLVPSDFDQVTPRSNMLTQRAQVSTVANPNSLVLGVLHTVRPGEPANPALDLAIVSKANNSVQILRNSGTGAFNTKLTLTDIGNSPTVVRTGDINNDGRTDLIVGNGSDYGLSVLYHNGSTTGIPYALANRLKFGLAGAGFDQKTSDLVVADFNGDGGDDVATANYRLTGSVNVFLTSPAPNYLLKLSQSLNVGRYAGAIAAADLDGDGDLDLVVSNLLDATLRMLKNNGSGVFTQFGGTLAVGAVPASIAVGNFNGDKWPNGRPRVDLAVANYGSVKVSILRSTGSFTFAPAASLAVPSGAASVVTGDIDADGDLDLIVAAGSDRASGGISLLRNRGNGVFGAAESQAVGLLTGINTFNVAVGKIDSNSSLDLVVTDGFNSQYNVFTNTILNLGSHQVNLSTGLETVPGLDFLVRKHTAVAAAGVELAAASDTGGSNLDNLAITNTTNEVSRQQQPIANASSGVRVQAFAGSTPIDGGNSNGKFIVATTNGSAVLEAGMHSAATKLQLQRAAQLASSADMTTTIAPIVPTASAEPNPLPLSDDDSSSNNPITSLATLNLSGKATAGSTLRLLRKPGDPLALSSDAQDDYFARLAEED